MTKPKGLMFVTGSGPQSPRSQRHIFGHNVIEDGLIQTVGEIVEAVDNISTAYPDFLHDKEIETGQVYALMPVSAVKNKELVAKIMGDVRKIRAARVSKLKAEEKAAKVKAKARQKKGGI